VGEMEKVPVVYSTGERKIGDQTLHSDGKDFSKLKELQHKKEGKF